MRSNRRWLRIGVVVLAGMVAVAAATVSGLQKAALNQAVEDNQYMAKIMDQENLISECMADRGFEYVAWVNPYEDPGGRVDADKRALFEDNPNEAIVADFTEAKYESYEEALWGPRADQVGDLSPLNGGCVSWAFEQVYGAPPEEVVAQQDAKLSKIDQAISNDPRIAAAEQDWAKCMKDEGYQVDTRTAFFNELWQEEDQLVAQATNAGVDDPTDLPAWVDFPRRRDASLAQEDECAKEYYWPVEERVTQEYVDEFWNQPTDTNPSGMR